MCVVGHSNGGLCGGRDEGGGWDACGKSRGDGRISADAEALPECKVILILTLMTPDHIAVQVRSSG